MRLPDRGMVDRKRPLTFTFDGRTYQGFAGDSVASALMADGLRVLGRSFKYHRPRGITGQGSEDPCALITVGSGAGRDPNVRATTQEIWDGLEAHAQNCWPSRQFDLMAVNDLAAPILGAGFYYKTFMWPRSFWEKFYEPMIRRAAGMGALSGCHNPDRYEKAYAFCDVLIIGAGPAGLMAARVAARGGADVILADEDSLMGGRLNGETTEIAGMAGRDWAAQVVAELSELANVRLMRRTTITGVYDHGTFAALERVGHHCGPRADLPRECFWRIVAKRAILAAGAIERSIAFPNNDRPGIMQASAVRTYLNRYGVAPGARIAVFGNNDEIYRTAQTIAGAGCQVVAVIDGRLEEAATPEHGTDFRVLQGAVVCNSHGRRGLRAITIRHGGGDTETLPVDCLAVSGGWNPSVHLSCHMGAAPIWEERLCAFIPAPGAVANMQPVGACNGAFSTLGALNEGAAAATQALRDLGRTAPAPLDSTPVEAEDTPFRITPLWRVEGRGRAWLDLQNDVTVKDVQLAARENYGAAEHMKRYTTQGMAPDQGKGSNVLALAVLAEATGQSLAAVGTTSYRPPYTPVAIAAIGAGAQGKGFAPRRLSTSHTACQERAAPMIEAGLWYRPSYFPRQGETHWRQACDREVTMVRTAVGVADVSTLGKVDIQGPDAARFLDVVYANRVSTLAEGRVRYGLMLREDGMLMDDGTAARLGPQHYVITTTTAAAGQVMRHLTYVHQCLHPELDLCLASATEQWAQFAVAGPRSREMLGGLLAAPVDNASFPFMACGSVEIGGVGARLFRISFSGEHAYEIAVPARYGGSLFRLLVAQAEAMGGGAYGMEALNVLRIEKGFLTHAEMDGRTTADDLGLGRMVSAHKDCIGKTMGLRPALRGAERAQLVGLRPLDRARQITAGAHLYALSGAAIRENAQGHVSSAGYSPTLGHFIGLGLLQNGRARLGEIIALKDHLRAITAECEVCAPVFYDPEGKRVHG